MSLRIGTRSSGNSTNNPATFTVKQLAEIYNTGRVRDRDRIEKDVRRRDISQQVHFQEKVSCLVFLTEQEQDQCHDQLPQLYTILFNTPRKSRIQWRNTLGHENFDEMMKSLIDKEIVDETRYWAIMNYFMH